MLNIALYILCWKKPTERNKIISESQYRNDSHIQSILTNCLIQRTSHITFSMESSSSTEDLLSAELANMDSTEALPLNIIK